MRLLDPFLYEKVHLLIILAFTIYYFSLVQSKKADALLHRRRSTGFIFLYAVLFIIIVGLRPVSEAFGDTVSYAATFNYYGRTTHGLSFTRDSLFYLFMWKCSQYMSVNGFFLIIETIYILPMVIGIIRLFDQNSDIALLFSFAAFSFFTYSVNGIRNGIALSLVILAISFIRGALWEKLISAVIIIIAISFHASAALPVVCMIAAYFIKKTDIIFFFWVATILISLVAGNYVSGWFATLGFDDRLSDYILSEVDDSVFSHVGFRWDFLLYSSMPIILGWYVIFKKQVVNTTYRLLLGTYVFANAFWIMVIRAEFSNRFAYLSWFLYPIVLAYPLLKLRIWPKTQGQKTALIMLAHLAFSLFMVFVVG